MRDQKKSTKIIMRAFVKKISTHWSIVVLGVEDDKKKRQRATWGVQKSENVSNMCAVGVRETLGVKECYQKNSHVVSLRLLKVLRVNPMCVL